MYRSWLRGDQPPLTALPAGHGPATPRPVTVVVLARDEERCLARCLDSVVTGDDAPSVLVLDTGSRDATPDIARRYRDRGVRLVQQRWPGSFADARNAALGHVDSGWVVFLDADEWLPDGEVRRLRACLAALDHVDGLATTVFAPGIQEADTGLRFDDIPRILLADGLVRFRGPVHEYPVVRASDDGRPDQPPRLVQLDLTFHHDGYRPDVVADRRKPERNLALLDAALAAEPRHPRWVFFRLRDALPTLPPEEIETLCAELAHCDSDGTGDRLTARHYRRQALAHSCQRLAVLGEWRAIHRHCDHLEELDGTPQPDAHYYRTTLALLDGTATDADLLATVRLRKAESVLARSALDRSGRHLDALLTTLLHTLRDSEQATRYRELCQPWTDAFYVRSRLRPPDDR